VSRWHEQGVAATCGTALESRAARGTLVGTMSMRRVAVLVVAAAVGSSVAAVVTHREPNAPAPSRVGDPFAAWMDAPFPAADGFDPPEPGSTDVAAIGAGRVVDVASDAVVVEHLVYENHRRRVVRSRYVRLSDVQVRAGAVVARGQRLGRGPSRVEILHASGDAEDAAAFIAARRRLPVPQAEQRVLLIDSGLGRARLYERGVRAGEWSAGLGQIVGCKEERDDGRSPCGMYFVTNASTGPFSGPGPEYFGGHWLGLNYPNPWDAERGLAAGLITADERDRIAAAWAARQATPRGTRLGDGIGLHGWVEDWAGDAGPRGSLGCAFFRADDIRLLYELLAPGAMVVLW
jgi:hypothetical protein